MRKPEEGAHVDLEQFHLIIHFYLHERLGPSSIDTGISNDQVKLHDPSSF